MIGRWGLTPHLLAAAASSSPYTSRKVVAAVLTIILVVVVGGLLVPFVARWRAKRLSSKLQREQGPEQLKRLNDRLAVAKRKSHLWSFAVLLGADGRVSTSKTIATLWTVVIAYVLIALLLVPATDWDTALRHLDWTYFALLGGPYASLVLAKAAVTVRVNNGSLQKTAGPGVPRLSDLIGDDSGKPDLFDVQYVVFNLIAMGFVVSAFWHATLAGFPMIPNGLILLTGGPAAVYLSNKVFTSNSAVIFTVSPSVVGPGGPFTVFGQNLAPDGGTGDGAVLAAPVARTGQPPPATAPGGTEPPKAPEVEVGGKPATVPAGWTGSAISAMAPTEGVPLGVPLGVAVVTSAGQRAYLDGALTVLGPPKLIGADRGSARAGDTVTLHGEWTIGGGRTVVVLVDRVVAQLVGAANAGTASFVVPALGGTLPRTVDVVLVVGGEESGALRLEIAP